MSTDLDQPARQARAENLRERARLVEAAGPIGEISLVRAFNEPTVYELQAQERSHADGIAEHAATTIFGVNTRDRLTPRIASDLEQGAMALVRRIHPEWVKEAHERAVDALMESDEFRALMRDRGRGEAMVLAHRFVVTMRLAYHGVLESTRPINIGTYLKIAAAATERGAL